jgi:hypothetical protein
MDGYFTHKDLFSSDKYDVINILNHNVYYPQTYLLTAKDGNIENLIISGYNDFKYYLLNKNCDNMTIKYVKKLEIKEIKEIKEPNIVMKIFTTMTIFFLINYLNIYLFSDINYDIVYFNLLYIGYYIFFLMLNYSDKFILCSISILFCSYNLYIFIYLINNTYNTYYVQIKDLTYIFSEKFLIYDINDTLITLWKNTFNYYLFELIFFNNLSTSSNIHHTLSIYCSYLFINKYHGLSMLPMMTMISTIFLDLIKLGYDNIITRILFSSSFILFRIIIPDLYMYKICDMLYNNHFLILLYGIILMSLNHYWLYMIIKKIINNK